MRSTHHETFIIALAAVMMAVAACQQGRSGNRDLDRDSTVGFGADRGENTMGAGLGGIKAGNGTGSSSGTSPDAGARALANALEGFPTENAAQASAIQQAIQAVDELARGFASLKQGASLDTIRQALSRISGDKDQLEEIARILDEAGLPQLAQALREIAARREIFCFFNPTRNRHIFSATGPSGPDAYEFQYVGWSFNTYPRPRNRCSRPLYGCYLAQGGHHYVALSENCDGGQLRERLGHVCADPQSYASFQLFRFYGNGGDHFVTYDKGVINLLTSAGWQNEGSLGFPPN